MIRLPPEIHRELRIQAAKDDLSMSKLCIMFVIAGLERKGVKLFGVEPNPPAEKA